MISKAKIKYIRSLELKKFRKTENAFVAEGPKVVGDLLHTTDAIMIVAVADWLAANTVSTRTEAMEVTDDELRKVSFLQHPQQVLAVFPTAPFMQRTVQSSLTLALDGVQDPGNLGTIIRVADWFGIEQIFCSNDTVDAFSPKVVQATMGSLAHVRTIYGDLKAHLESFPTGTPIYGTLLDGNNIYEEAVENHGVIVMGNESKGISSEIRKRINHKLLIPNYPTGRETTDSLNVAIATAIVCAEFRRR